MRLFTAVPLNFNVQDAIAQVLQKSDLSPALVKWVVPTQAHLTLRFLDDQEESLIPSIQESLSGAAEGLAPFEVRMGGVGAFPNMKKPRVIYIPVMLGAEALGALNTKITESLMALGLKFEGKEFHAHVTLGRVKTFKEAAMVAEQAQAICPENLGKINVDHFALFQSELTPKGPIYTSLKKFQLKG